MIEILYNSINKNLEGVLFGIISSILATIFVLITRNIYISISNSRPANNLFNKIKGSKEDCIIHQVRLKDQNKSGTYLMPTPSYSSFPNEDSNFEHRQLIPWVVSAEDSNASAMILNVLGKIGKTENIKLSYVDLEYDLWDNPMFLLGGSSKTTRVFEKYNSTYNYENYSFVVRETGESFRQKDPNDDLGLLMKTYNPLTKSPIWVAMGMRGSGTAGATFALVKWWKIFGKLYGKGEFGVVIQFNDIDGWKDSVPISYSPEPKIIRKIFYPFAYRKLKSMIKKY